MPKPLKSQVQVALPGEEDALWEMLLGLHDENGIFSPDEPRVREFIHAAIEAKGGLIGVIRSQDTGALEASIGLVIDQWWYTLDWCLSERWVYVVPECRKTDHAARMVDWAKASAARLGIPLQMGILSTIRTEAKEKMYERKMKRVGGFYMWNPDHEVRTGHG